MDLVCLPRDRDALMRRIMASTPEVLKNGDQEAPKTAAELPDLSQKRPDIAASRHRLLEIADQRMILDRLTQLQERLARITSEAVETRLLRGRSMKHHWAQRSEGA